MKNLEDMLTKKSDKSEMSKEEIQAKMEVLQELMDMCKDKMGETVKSGMDEIHSPKEMQKVTVAAPDSESLALGLDKAKDIAEDPKMMKAMEKMPSMLSEDEEESDHVNPFDMSDEEDEDSMFAKRK